MNFARLSTPQKISAVSSIVVVVGAFLPWASFLGVNAYGIKGDGVITLVLAVAGLVLLGLSAGVVGPERVPGKVAGVAGLVLAVLVTFIGLNDTTNFAAIGVYLTDLGGIAWIVGAAWQLVAGNKKAVAPLSPPNTGQ